MLDIVRPDEARQARRWETLCTTTSVSLRTWRRMKSATTTCSARPKLVSKLLNGNKVRIVVKRLEDGSQRKITDAVRQFVSADNQRGRVIMGESAKHMVALPVMHPKFDLEMFQVRVSWQAMKN